MVRQRGIRPRGARLVRRTLASWMSPSGGLFIANVLVGCEILERFQKLRGHGFGGHHHHALRSDPQTGIHGVVSYKGDELIRDVQVCGGGSCTSIFAGLAMKKGQRAEFLLSVDNLDPVTLSVGCELFK